MPTESTMLVSLPAAAGNRVLLEQGIDLLGCLAPAAYIETPSGHSSVGTQVRHILDHYEAFFTGLDDRRVDYDARRRDASLATDIACALEAARQWARALEGIDVAVGDVRLRVQSDSGALDGSPDWRDSTIGRELQFLASHTTHHYALIKLLLEFQGVDTDAAFGTAPSTRAFTASSR